jgi:DNA-binding NarL/FixJ family response regulator
MPSNTTSSDPLRVVLVDDNAALLDRAAAVLSPGCEIAGKFTDGATALAAADDLHADVIVLDISMPGMSGLDVACALRTMHSRSAVVFLTMHDDEDLLRAAIASGGIGYVLKRRLASDLRVAIEEAKAGRPFVSALG